MVCRFIDGCVAIKDKLKQTMSECHGISISGTDEEFFKHEKFE